MGSFLIFFVLCILLIITVVLLVVWLVAKRKDYGKAILFLWGGIFILGIGLYATNSIFSKKVLDKKDFYGHYIIDRDYFPGEQADWQYNNFRFEIKENDSLYFYVTDGQKINKTYRGKIAALDQYKSARLVVKMEEPNHHILKTNPTIYRDTWDFFMVFNSPKFSNMYFRKGKWAKIE